MTQLTLWDDIPQQDTRPLPLIIASEHGFNLAYVDRDGNPDKYLYNVQDWLRGITGDDNIRQLWQEIKKRLENSEVKKNFTSEKLPYKATDGKTYQRDFTNDYGLYAITMRLNKSRPNVESTLNRFAAHVKFADYARRNPETVAKQLTARAKGIEARNQMTAAAQETKDDQRPFYGILTDKQYEILLGRTKKKIVQALGMNEYETTHFRDQLGEQALDALRMTESAAAAKMRRAGRALTHDEQLEIVIACSEIVAPSYERLVDYLEVDRVRNQPLLGGAR